MPERERAPGLGAAVSAPTRRGARAAVFTPRILMGQTSMPGADVGEPIFNDLQHNDVAAFRRLPPDFRAVGAMDQHMTLVVFRQGDV